MSHTKRPKDDVKGPDFYHLIFLPTPVGGDLCDCDSPYPTGVPTRQLGKLRGRVVCRFNTVLKSQKYFGKRIDAEQQQIYLHLSYNVSNKNVVHPQKNFCKIVNYLVVLHCI